jgi:sterol desaturase/sphingolipid hydroxylase (fatty acid hydroxylase superfamily)
MIGIFTGLVFSNIGEWLIHKHLLHGQGRNKKSFWAFHWHEHHREAYRRGMIDPQYQKPIALEDTPQAREAAALVVGAATLLPLLPIAPFFTVTVWNRMWNYYKVHKRSHLDPQWAKDNMPWHHDHHMGKDQNANWCVTHPWFDYVMKTRKPYLDDPTGALPEGATGGLMSRMWEGLQESRRVQERIAEKKTASPVKLAAA